jgi:hypothetical protein
MIQCFVMSFFVFFILFFIRVLFIGYVFLVCLHFHGLCLVRLQVYDWDLAIFCRFPWLLVPLCGSFVRYVCTFILLLCDLSPTAYLYQILFVCKYIVDTREKFFS